MKIQQRLDRLAKAAAAKRPPERARPGWTCAQQVELDRLWAEFWETWSPAQRGAILRGWDSADLWAYLDGLTPAQRAAELAADGLPPDFSRTWRPPSEAPGGQVAGNGN